MDSISNITVDELSSLQFVYADDSSSVDVGFADGCTESDAVGPDISSFSLRTLHDGTPILIDSASYLPADTLSSALLPPVTADVPADSENRRASVVVDVPVFNTASALSLQEGVHGATSIGDGGTTGLPAEQNSWSCEKCDRKYNSRRCYDTHMASHDLDKPLSCTGCLLSFNLPKNLQIHKMLHDPGRLRCDECGRCFRRSASLRAHIATHMEDDALNCVQCGAKLATKSLLDKHLLTQCCRLDSADDRQRQTQERTTVVEFILPAAPSQPRNSQKNHSALIESTMSARNSPKSRSAPKNRSSRTFCHRCNKHLATPAILKRHMLVHTGEKPFKCDQCSSAFNQKTSLQAHKMTIHGGLRPFQCPLCEAWFGLRGNLRSHMRSVHADQGDAAVGRTLQCDQCSCKFTQPGSLNTHRRKMHIAPQSVGGDGGWTVDRLVDFLRRLVRFHSDCGSDRGHLRALIREIWRSGVVPTHLLRNALTQLRPTGNAPPSSAAVTQSALVPGTVSSQPTMPETGPITAVDPNGGSVSGSDEALQTDIAEVVACLDAMPLTYSMLAAEFANRLISTATTECATQDISCVGSTDYISSQPSIDVPVAIPEASVDADVSNKHQKAGPASSLGTDEMNVGSLAVAGSLPDASTEVDGRASTEVDSRASTEVDGRASTEVDGRASTEVDGRASTEVDGRASTEVDGRASTEVDGRASMMVVSDLHAQGGLRKHLVRVRYDATGMRWLQCLFCHREQRKAADMVRHLRLHSDDRPFHCRQCPRRFRLQTGLVSHRRLAHQRAAISQRTYGCAYCLRQFRHLTQLRAHVTLCHHVNSDATSQKQLEESRPFQCDSCPMRFKQKSHLHSHRRLHTGERPYLCSVCGRRFNTVCAVKEHLVTHTGRRAFGCTLCRARFGTASSLKRHMTTHTDLRPFICPHCSKGFKTRFICAKHIQTVHDDIAQTWIDPDEPGVDVLAQIDISNTLLPQEDVNDTAHIRNQEPLDTARLDSTLTDAICVLFPEQHDSRDVTGVVEELRQPVQAVVTCGVSVAEGATRGDVVVADDTSQYSRVPSRIAPKVEVSLEPSPTSSQCITAESQFQRDSFEHLAASRTSDNAYNCGSLAVPVGDTASTLRCGLCDYQLLSTEALRRHIEGKHAVTSNHRRTSAQMVVEFNDLQTAELARQPLNDLQSPGEVCLIRSAQEKVRNIPSGPRSKLADDHEDDEERSTRNKHQCQVCLNSFLRPSDLKRHLRMHTGEKPFSCGICQKRFTLKSTLKTHARTHTGERSFQCLVCHTSFSSKNSLLVHTRIHTGAKPYACSVCDRHFRTPGQLKVHGKTHSDAGAAKGNALAAKPATVHIRVQDMTAGGACSTLSDNSSRVGPALVEAATTTTDSCAVTDLLPLSVDPLTSVADPVSSSSVREANYIIGHPVDPLWNEKDQALDPDDPSAQGPLAGDEFHSPAAEMRSRVAGMSSLLQPRVVADMAGGDGGEVRVQLQIDSDGRIVGLETLHLATATDVGHGDVVSGDAVHDASTTDTRAVSACLERALVSANRSGTPNCSRCGVQFRLRRELREHMHTTHGGDASARRPHACDHCWQSFSKPSLLRRHMRHHTGERPFQCTLCARAFTQANALQLHMRTHSQERPFSCPFCGEAFSQRGNMHVHVRRAHLQAAVGTLTTTK